jgi:hypothetical protein
MPVKPINLRDLETKVENLYEAIVVLSKRSQQINEEIKIEFNQRLELITSKIMTEEPDEPESLEPVTNPDQIIISREFEKRPKATELAIRNLLNNELEFKYKEEPNP